MKNQTIENTREWFKTRYGLMPFAGNFSHNRRYAPSDWLCRCKTTREEEGHITSGSCEVYGDLKSQFGDLKEDKNLVDFFRAVLDRRDELEEEDRQQEAAAAAVIARPVCGYIDRTSRHRDLPPIESI